MKCKHYLLLAIATLTLATVANAQSYLEANKKYGGAIAIEDVYKVIFQMDQGSSEIIKKTIRNINNLLKDPRLSGKLQIQVVAFSGGIDAYRKSSGYEADFKNLVRQGVIVSQCLNTLEDRQVSKEELYDFLAYVPTGNGELLIRASEGWTIIKP